MPYNPTISPLQDGEDGAASVLNRPHNRLLENTDFLKAIFDKLTTKGDLLSLTAAANFARLGIGANDQILIADSTQSLGFKWGAITNPPVVVEATYGMTTLTGNQTITGAGGPPKAVIAVCLVSDQKGPAIGMTDGSGAGGVHFFLEDPAADTQGSGDDVFLKVSTDTSSNRQTGTFSSFNSDGMVIAWVKTGSPTGTMDQFFIFFF